MAPPGSHIVKRHAKVTSEGFKYYVKAHIRKNRGKKVVLLPENILYLYWHGDQEYPRIGKINEYVKKSFCKDCGSAVPTLQMNSTLLATPAGSLDSELDVLPNGHIFYSSKASWDIELEKIRKFKKYPE